MQRSVNVLYCVVMVFCLAAYAHAATFTVTKVEDSNDGNCDSDCSLREAIAAANASADNDTVEFGALFTTPQTIVLTNGEMVVLNNGTLTINGPGAQFVTIDGNNATRIMTASREAVVFIKGLRLRRGNSNGVQDPGRGGAFYNWGATTVIRNSVIEDSTSSLGGGALNNSASNSPTPGIPGHLTLIECVIANNSGASGGSIQNFSTSTLIIDRSLFTGNQSNNSTGGGAIAGNGMVHISNSTFSGNRAPSGSGGGIQSNGSLMVLNNVTVTGNTSANNGGGIHRGTSNVNIYLRNSIVAGNTGTAASPDITHSAAGAITSLGNNIIGATGTSTGWIGTDILNTDPKLAPFGFYGGSMTHALLSDSPAINAGQNCVRSLTCDSNNPPFVLTLDQRNAVRDDAAVDIGAYEVNPAFRGEVTGSADEPFTLLIAPDNAGFTYEVTAGSLPPGLALTTALAERVKAAAPSSVVSLTGVPTQAGTYDFTLTMTGPAGSGSANYRITIGGASAEVSVGGRVRNAAGYMRPNVAVTMTGAGNTVRIARTSSFGYFRFDDVPPGSYTISVADKHNTYAPQNVAVSGDVTDIDFVPLP